MSIRLLRFANTRSFSVLDAVSFCMAGCMTSLVVGLTRIIAG